MPNKSNEHDIFVCLRLKLHIMSVKRKAKLKNRSLFVGAYVERDLIFAYERPTYNSTSNNYILLLSIMINNFSPINPKYLLDGLI